MKQKIYLIDMRFSSSGHYMDDLKEFRTLNKKYNCYYLANTSSNIEMNGFKIKTYKNALFFYINLFFLLLKTRHGKIIFLSASYLPLLILSLLSVNFNYKFRIHALPTIRISLYKRVIKFLSDMSTHTIFLDKPVLDFFIDNNLVNINKSKVLIGRTINHANHSVDFSSRSSDNKFKLTYIGALNDEKDLLPIIKGLSSQKIPGLELGFYSKGIKKYKNELEALTIIYPSTEIIDSFLSREEYDSIIHRSDALILPYKKTYGVRFSAVLNDALRLGKPVLTINLPQFKYYKDKYNACSLYSDHNEIIKSVTSLINNPDIDIDLLNYDYSERIKEKQIKELEL